MTKTDDKIEALLAKHPNLTKPDAIKILNDKNERKKQKRAEKSERNNAKSLKGLEKRAEQNSN